MIPDMIFELHITFNCTLHASFLFPVKFVIEWYVHWWFVIMFLNSVWTGDMHEDLKPTAPFKYPEEIRDFNVKEVVEGEKLKEYVNGEFHRG